MRSVLAQIQPDQVIDQPFPHVAIENALDGNLARQLVAEFPALEYIANGKELGSNRKLYLSAKRALHEGRAPKVWKDVIRAHAGQAEWRELVRIFRRQIDREYPDFRDRIGDPDALTVGTRDIETFAEADVLMDCKALAHTPVTGDTKAERGPHLKNFRTLFLWYVYLRADHDDAAGADHTLYTPKPGVSPVLGPRQTLDLDQLDEARVIPFRHNTLVVFMNTPRSFQTNSPRAASPLPVMAVHVSAYIRERLFSVRMAQGVAPNDFIPPPPAVAPIPRKQALKSSPGPQGREEGSGGRQSLSPDRQSLVAPRQRRHQASAGIRRILSWFGRR